MSDTRSFTKTFVKDLDNKNVVITNLNVEPVGSLVKIKKVSYFKKVMGSRGVYIPELPGNTMDLGILEDMGERAFEDHAHGKFKIGDLVYYSPKNAFSYKDPIDVMVHHVVLQDIYIWGAVGLEYYIEEK